MSFQFKTWLRSRFSGARVAPHTSPSFLRPVSFCQSSEIELEPPIKLSSFAPRL